MPHHSTGPGAGVPPVLLLLAAVAVLGYLAAALPLHAQGRWPATRSALWCAGWLAVAGAVAGPFAGPGFRVHMAGHLLLGMLAPLLLALAAPVTLALRALPVAPARTLVRVLRSPPLRVLASPAVAAALSAGGLWLLYSTGLHAATHHEPALRQAVQIHVLAAGYLFTAAIVGVDPDPHRASRPLRAAVLVLALAAHEVLAKHLYAHPPAGVPVADGQAGAQLMYYGGDAVELAVMIVLCRQWYVAEGRVAAPAVTAARPPRAAR